MRAAWATDIHLEFVEAPRREQFVDSLREADPDCVLVGGDIGHALSTRMELRRIVAAVGKPVYFVLGNHDYYGGSIATVRHATASLCDEVPDLHWLNIAGAVSLSRETALVGHDGWADGRLGDYAGSPVELNDYYVIDEFKGLDREARLEQLGRLGDEAARHFRSVLPLALQRHRNVVALTHVPPFRDACWHRGTISGDHWLPHFACHAAGAAMIEVMSAYPDGELLVLCGHTHSGGDARIRPNLRVVTGDARYGDPVLQRVFEWT